MASKTHDCSECFYCRRDYYWKACSVHNVHDCSNNCFDCKYNKYCDECSVHNIHDVPNVKKMSTAMSVLNITNELMLDDLVEIKISTVK